MFEPNDIVECVDQGPHGNLIKVGGRYRIDSIRGGFLYVELENGNIDGGFYPKRFKIIKPSKRDVHIIRYSKGFKCLSSG